MKVYELMGELSKLPSGAEVSCSATLTVKELESGSKLFEDDEGGTAYAVTKNFGFVECEDDHVYLNF